MANDEIYLGKIFNIYVTSIKRWMLPVGLWPFARPKMIYRLVGIFTVISTIVMSYSTIQFSIVYVSNLSLVVKGISATASLTTITLKGLLVIFHRKDLLKIYETLENYHGEMSKDDNLRYLTIKSVRPFRSLQKIQTYSTAISGLVYNLGPLIKMTEQYVTNGMITKYMLPVPAIVPWHFHPGGISYILTYIFEVYNMLILLCITCGVDAFFALILLYVIGQLRVLAYKIENIQKYDNYCEILRQCVSRYILLRKCCITLQNVYGPIILWMLVTNSVAICAVIFQMSQQSDNPVAKYGYMLSYAAAKSIQTYEYAFAGTSLTTESEALLNSIYFSNWPEFGCQQFSTSILTMLMQPPLQVVIVKFMIVSMEMFIMIMNSSVSYFFLLKTVEEKSS